MSYPIEKKLVIAVASSALFNLEESDRIFRTQGVEAYSAYQASHADEPFGKGVAFPFVRRLLHLNASFPDESPVEVVLLSRNNAETGRRAFNSIQHYGLPISRAVFTSGTAHFQYLKSFNATLFLSADAQDVRDALQSGVAAGRVLNKGVEDDENDMELRIAFDFDSVLVDDEAEKVYAASGDIGCFHAYEKAHADEPLRNGPVRELLLRIAYYQEMERAKQAADPSYRRILSTAIVTARSAPAHERMFNTLKAWHINVDKLFLLGGIDKARVLNILRPHIFFDDQVGHFAHLDPDIPAVHIPFGVCNPETP